jgi:hypothetical protein
MSHPKKVQTRKEEMFHLIDQQIASGLSQLHFCQNQQISIATFSYWRKQYLTSKDKNNHPPANQFIPLKIKTPLQENQENQKKHSIEIQLPNKIILRCQNWEIQQLPSLIAQLQKTDFAC